MTKLIGAAVVGLAIAAAFVAWAIGIVEMHEEMTKAIMDYKPVSDAPEKAGFILFGLTIGSLTLFFFLLLVFADDIRPRDDWSLSVLGLFAAAGIGAAAYFLVGGPLTEASLLLFLSFSRQRLAGSSAQRRKQRQIYKIRRKARPEASFFSSVKLNGLTPAASLFMPSVA